MAVTTTESKLKADLVEAMRAALPGAVVFRHEDRITAGHPDISVTYFGRTTWWEGKLVAEDQKFHTSGQQELTMLRLSGAGYARYLIWWVSPVDPKRMQVRIVHPRHLKEWQVEGETISLRGPDHKTVIEHIRGVHKPS